MAEEKDNKTPDPSPKDAAAKSTPKAKPAAKAKAESKPAADAKPVAKKATDAKAEEKKPAAKKPVAKKSTDAKVDDKKSAEKKSASKKDSAKKDAKAKSSGRRRAKAEAKVVAQVDEDGNPIMVRATARYVHSSPRKARLVVDNIRGKSVPQARITLNFMQRHVARDVAKVLESAVANAEHNHELDGDDLHVAHVFVDQGPTLKRFRPRARGVASPIMKRTSHITVVVSPTSAKELARKKATA